MHLFRTRILKTNWDSKSQCLQILLWFFESSFVFFSLLIVDGCVLMWRGRWYESGFDCCFMMRRCMRVCGWLRPAGGFQVWEKATTNTGVGAVNPRPSYSKPERDSSVGCRLRTVHTWFTFPMCRPFLPRRVTLAWTRMHDTLTSFCCFSFFRNGKKTKSRKKKNIFYTCNRLRQTLACYEW